MRPQRGQFSAPGAGQFGNTGRNFFVGPHYFELDASLLKRVPINERVKLEFRADATNLTNYASSAPDHGHHQHDLRPHSELPVSSSRKIQLGAKIHF